MKNKFRKGNIVRSGNLKVLVTGQSKYKGYSAFCGVALNNEKDSDGRLSFIRVGNYSDTWNLDAFKKTDLIIHLRP